MTRPTLLWAVVLLIFTVTGFVVSWFYVFQRNAIGEDYYGAGFVICYCFLLGLSQFCAVFSVMMRIVKAEWSRALLSLAESAALAFLPMAVIGMLLIYVYVAPQLFYWWNDDAHIWLNRGMFLLRHAIALLLFYAVLLIYLHALKHGRRENMPVLCCALMLAYVLQQTFVAWDFGMMLIPHWHSSVYPIYCWVANFSAGLAMLFILAHWPVLAGKKPLLQVHELKYFAVLLLGFCMLWFYMFWAHFFVIWFGRLPQEMQLFERIIYGAYRPFFWFMLSAIFLLPFASLIFASVKRSRFLLLLISSVIMAGVLCQRYLMVMPALTSEHAVFSSPFYLSVLLGFTACYLLLLLLLRSLLQPIPLPLMDAGVADEES